MKGRNSFSREEAEQIKDLLDKKIKSGNLKPFRDKLRKIGFFCVVFKRVASGFTPEDFDDLVRTKRVFITDDPQLQETNSKAHAKLGENRIQSFQPVVSEQAQMLILGTMPGGTSLSYREYYADSSNKFWQIIEKVYGGRFGTYKDRVETLMSNRIALWDVLASCERSGSSDKNIINPIPNDFEEFFAFYPGIKQIFFNGQDARHYYEILVLPTLSSAAKQCLLATVPSSSRAYARTLDLKAEVWKERLKSYA